MRPNNMYLRTPLIELSNLIFSTDILVSHYIDEKVKKEQLINVHAILDIFVPSYPFLFEYLGLLAFSFFFAAALAAFLSKGTKKRRSFKWLFSFDLLFNLFSQDNSFFKRSTAVGQFFLFNLLFLFVVRNLLTNCIKTSRVIVDTQQLIDTEEKIYQVESYSCIEIKITSALFKPLNH